MGIKADIIVRLKLEHPEWTPERVTTEANEELGCDPPMTVASVSSTISRKRREGVLPPASTRGTPGAIPGVYERAKEADTPEIREARAERIRTRYETLSRMAERVANAALPALIVSGPPGLGKSYTVEQALLKTRMEDEYDILSGTVSGPGLYTALYNQRDGVVVLDDCDSALADEACLNLLKTVLDSSEKRVVTWRKKARWLDEEDIPEMFEFHGSVVFCTNIDFEHEAGKGTARAPHLQALVDRCLYLSLTTRTLEDVKERIRQVIDEQGMLNRYALGEGQAQEVRDYALNNAERFYSLSLRLVHQIAHCAIADPNNWKDDVEVTKMRTT